mmetsp:Transcript_105312/g.296510  ORF Transcript_105312/g.296510 Transcript_105312/m.296510 type:complete len:252 (-) Transcript_105312:201-956(-)
MRWERRVQQRKRRCRAQGRCRRHREPAQILAPCGLAGVPADVPVHLLCDSGALRDPHHDAPCGHILLNDACRRWRKCRRPEHCACGASAGPFSSPRLQRGEDFHAPDCWRRGLNWCSVGICAVLRFLCSLRSLSGSWPRGCRHLLIDARDRLHLDAYWSSLARVDEPIWHRPCPRRGDHPSRDGYQRCDADMYRLLPRLGVAIDGRHPLVGFCHWLNSTRAQLRQSNEFSEESQWLRWRRSGGEHHTLGTR